MKSSLVQFVITLILIINFNINNVESCSCFPTHPQTQFCNSEFAILAVPRCVKKAGTQLKKYCIKIIETYKATDKAKPALETKTIFTGDNSAMCGAELTLNEKYVLTGGIDSDGKATINLCGFNSKYEDLTEAQKNGFEGEYSKNCGICEIRQDDGDNPTRRCKADFKSLFCYMKFSICKLVNNRCTWDSCDGLDECLGGTE